MGRPVSLAPGWLVAVRHLIGLVVGTLAVIVPMTPGLMPWVAAAIFPMTLGYALLVGGPVVLVMRQRNRIGPLPTVAAGALVGAVPAGLFGALISGPAAIMFFALLGAGVAFVAWLVASLLALPDRVIPPRFIAPAGGATALATVVAAVLGTIGVSDAMQGPTDTTCHNTMRDGRRSVSAVASASLDIPDSEWPRLRTLMAAQAQAGSWSIRDYSHSSAEVRRVALSLCREPGTQLNVDKLVFPDHPLPVGLQDISIATYQPQGGESWIPLVRGVYRAISVTWPGKLTFKDGGGRIVGAPEWYCSADGGAADPALCRSGHTQDASAASASPIP